MKFGDQCESPVAFDRFREIKETLGYECAVLMVCTYCNECWLTWAVALLKKNSLKINFEGKKNSENCQYQSVIREIQSVIRGN